jgi:hypothetical protein
MRLDDFLRRGASCGLLAAAALLSPVTAGPAASEPAHPQGTWGTASACVAWRSGEETKPELTLYQIGPQWIQRHIFFCLIRPQMTVPTPDGRWLLQVVCGEDGRQAGHDFTMNLDREGALTASWTAIGDNMTFTFGPFERCDR